MGQTKALLALYDRSVDTPPQSFIVAAPVSGEIIRVLQKSETIVEPGTPLVEIGDCYDLEIVVFVLSTDAVEIEPWGQGQYGALGWSGLLDRRRPTVSVKNGDAAAVIKDELTMQKTDLVVMGTHARSGIEHILIGSVAEESLRSSACDILVVPVRQSS